MFQEPLVFNELTAILERRTDKIIFFTFLLEEVLTKLGGVAGTAIGAAVTSGVASNLIGAAVSTAFGRDCKGRPQGDYFYGCQVY